MDDRTKLTGHFFFMLAVCIVVIYVLSGCANVKGWKKVVTEDRINNIVVTEITYGEDTSFTLGSKGLGEYFLIKLEGF